MQKKLTVPTRPLWAESAWVWLGTILLAGLVGAGTSALIDYHAAHGLNFARAWLVKPTPFDIAVAPPKVPELVSTVAVKIEPAIVAPTLPHAAEPIAATIINPTPQIPAEALIPPQKRRDGQEKAIACLTKEAKALLARVEAQFGQVQVVSTCRPGAVVAGTGRPSLHRYGRAIDFLAPSGKKAAVVAWLAKNHSGGGTMTYQDSRHIHIDIGRHFVSLAGERRVAHASRKAKVRNLGRDDDWWEL